MLIAAIGVVIVELAFFLIIVAADKIGDIVVPKLRELIEMLQDHFNYGGELRIRMDRVNNNIISLVIKPALAAAEALVLGLMILKKGANFASKERLPIMDEIDDFLSRKKNVRNNRQTA